METHASVHAVFQFFLMLTGETVSIVKDKSDVDRCKYKCRTVELYLFTFNLSQLLYECIIVEHMKQLGNTDTMCIA